MRWRTAAGAVALTMMLWPLGAAAQDVASSLDELRRSGGLRPGDAVLVTDDTGRRIEGRVSDLTSTMLAVTGREETWSLTAAAVSKIEHRDSVVDGIFKGVGISVAGWFGACWLETQANEFCYLSYYSFWPMIAAGALIGHNVDARTRKTLYQAPGSRRFTVAPVLSPGRLGAAASLSW